MKKNCTNTLRTLVLVTTVLLGMNVSASESELNGVFRFGLDFGGETLGTFFFNGGSSQDVKSHEGVYLAGGMEYEFVESLFIRGTIGYKFNTVTASNGEADFSRVPLEFLLIKKMGVHRLGGGTMYHVLSNYSCKFDNVCDFSIGIRNALGWLVEYGYEVLIPNRDRKMTIGIRYSRINYTPESGGDTVAGKGLGVSFGFLF